MVGGREILDSDAASTPIWTGVGQQKSCQIGIGTVIAARKLATSIQLR